YRVSQIHERLFRFRHRSTSVQVGPGEVGSVLGGLPMLTTGGAIPAAIAGEPSTPTVADTVSVRSDFRCPALASPISRSSRFTAAKTRSQGGGLPLSQLIGK